MRSRGRFEIKGLDATRGDVDSLLGNVGKMNAALNKPEAKHPTIAIVRLKSVPLSGMIHEKICSPPASPCTLTRASKMEAA